MSLKSIVKITATSLLAVALLTSCAHPDFIKPGTSYDVVITELGQPDSTSQLEDGTIRLVYSGQPYDQSSYVMVFNHEGKLVEKYNILQEKYFKLIKPKVMHSEDILVLLGPPAEKWTYKNLGEHTFMYRYQDSAGFPMALWVDFDLENDEVVRYVLSIDPWSQRDSDWDVK